MCSLISGGMSAGDRHVAVRGGRLFPNFFPTFFGVDLGFAIESWEMSEPASSTSSSSSLSSSSADAADEDDASDSEDDGEDSFFERRSSDTTALVACLADRVKPPVEVDGMGSERRAKPRFLEVDRVILPVEVDCLLVYLAKVVSESRSSETTAAGRAGWGAIRFSPLHL